MKIIKDNNQFLNFKGIYSIEYKREKEDIEYMQQNGSKFVGNQLSIIFLNNDQLLKIEKNGTYYNPADLTVEGYFSWEKVANLLPIDYKVE